MDIHIIVATTDRDEIEQAARLIDFLRSDLPNKIVEPGQRTPPVPEEVLAVKTLPPAGINDLIPPLTTGTPGKKTTRKKKEEPGTGPTKPAAPLPSTGDFSTPVLAAQSLARSRKDGVATVTALVREFKVARVSELSKEDGAKFIARAKVGRGQERPACDFRTWWTQAHGSLPRGGSNVLRGASAAVGRTGGGRTDDAAGEPEGHRAPGDAVELRTAQLRDSPLRRGLQPQRLRAGVDRCREARQPAQSVALQLQPLDQTSFAVG
jgi:hypothetical protein